MHGGLLAKECLSFSIPYTYMYTHTRTPDPLPESAPDLVRQAVKERWQIYSLKPGLQALPDAMHSALLENGVEVALGQACTKINFAGNKVQVWNYLWLPELVCS